MSRVTRRRRIEAPPEAVWSLISDPYNLPRWWPRTSRVEAVERTKAGKRSQWTKVLETAEGRAVRADFRCISSAENERFIWEQQLEGTPFERIVKSAVTEIGLRAANGSTEVSVTSRQSLRGLSRLGSPMMRRATKEKLDEALDGIEQALVGPAEDAP